jgi:hypothetical protein
MQLQEVYTDYEGFLCSVYADHAGLREHKHGADAAGREGGSSAQVDDVIASCAKGAPAFGA